MRLKHLSYSFINKNDFNISFKLSLFNLTNFFLYSFLYDDNKYKTNRITESLKRINLRRDRKNLLTMQFAIHSNRFD